MWTRNKNSGISQTSRLLYVIISATFISGQQNFDFDCRRKGVNCGTGICNVNTGQCDCSDVTEFTPNYRCLNVEENPCQPSQYGADCSLSRVQVDCLRDKLYATIFPEQQFTGLIYVYGKEQTDACLFKEVAEKPDYVANKDDLRGSSLELPYTGSECGDARVTENTKNGTKETTYGVDLFIQYNTNVKSGLDQKISVTCKVVDGRTRVTGSIKETQLSQSNFKNVDVDSNADLDVVTFAIKGQGENDLPAQVDLGDEVQLVFTLIPGRGYVDLSLESCQANNSIVTSDNSTSANDFKSILIVENNCPSPDAMALFKDGVSKTFDPATGVTSKMAVSLSAFRFSGPSSDVGFACDVKLCRQDNRDECTKAKCDGITSKADEEVSRPNKTAATENNNNNTSSTNETTSSTDIINNNNNNATTSGNDTSVLNNTDTDSINTNTSTNANSSSPTTGTVDKDVSSVINESETGNSSSSGEGNNSTATAPAENGSGDPSNGDATAAATAEGGGNRRRKRRDAATEEDQLKHVYSQMSVRDPAAVVEDQEIPLETKDCLDEPEVVTVIAVLSSLVVIFFIAAIVIVVRMTSDNKVSRSKSTSGDDLIGTDAPYSKTSSPSSTSSFSIPRLEMTSSSYPRA